METGMQQQAYHYKNTSGQPLDCCRQVTRPWAAAKMASYESLASSVWPPNQLSAMFKQGRKRRRHWNRQINRRVLLQSVLSSRNQQLAPSYSCRSGCFQQCTMGRTYKGTCSPTEGRKHSTHEGVAHEWWGLGQACQQRVGQFLGGECSVLTMWSNNTTKCSRFCKIPSNCA